MKYNKEKGKGNYDKKRKEGSRPDSSRQYA